MGDEISQICSIILGNLQQCEQKFVGVLVEETLCSHVSQFVLCSSSEWSAVKVSTETPIGNYQFGGARIAWVC